MKFEEVSDYIDAYMDDPSLAVLSVSSTAELFGITNSAVIARIKSKTLTGVTIGNTRHVTMKSIVNTIRSRNEKVAIVKKFLEKEAKKGTRRVGYQRVMNLVGLDHNRSADRKEIGGILYWVSRLSFKEGGGLLSVLVQRKKTDLPGSGFFNIAGEFRVDWHLKYENEEDFVDAETDFVLNAHR